MSSPKPGDLVEVSVNGKTHLGILMPSPNLTGKDKILLKLKSGYNIGFDKKDVKSVKLIETCQEKKREGKTTTKTPGLKTISVLSTGGTISSKIDYRTGGVAAELSAKDLLDSMPELSGEVNLNPKSVMNVMSEDMTPKHWLNLAKEVAKELNSGADGVVVTHGTDTMHYSSAALSFLLNNTPKPIVFTGAQRSIDRGSSDGFMNLSCSILLAKSDYAGVGLVMHSGIDDKTCFAHHGVRVRKMHTSRRDAFQSINAKPFAKISATGEIEFTGIHGKRDGGDVKLDGGLEDKVAFIKAYPGMPKDLIDFYVEKKYKGIVFEGTALGHLPVSEKEHSLIPSIERAIDAGLSLAMTTQCLFGRVHPNVYSNLRELSSRGVIYCGDMLPEVGYVKMMWALNKSKSPYVVKKIMLTNACGEISEKSVIDNDFMPDF